MSNRFVVIDPSGHWLQQWRRQFVAYEIPHLRSPVVNKPDSNPYALPPFAKSKFDALLSMTNGQILTTQTM